MLCVEMGKVGELLMTLSGNPDRGRRNRRHWGELEDCDADGCIQVFQSMALLCTCDDTLQCGAAVN
jgi:hypothetical protein